MTAPVVIVGVNSWTTVAQADDYFAAKFGAAAWAALSAMQKTQLLISACRWIMQQPSLAVAIAVTAEIVRQAQCEAAWFILNFQDEYDKRRALISSGVKSFKALDFAETLGEIVFPQFIADMLFDYSVDSSIQFPRISRNLADNASE